MPPKKRKAATGLNADEERFVDEYLIDLNGTQAYIRANPGTKRTTAGELASRLLKKVKVRAAVRAGTLQLAKQCKTSALKEIKGIALIANYDLGAAFDMTVDDWVPLPPRKIPYETRQAMTAVKFKRRKERDKEGNEVATVEDVEYKFADKLAARDKLMRHFGQYADLPPLEVLLAALPPEVAATVRAALAAVVQGGRNPGGG